MQLRKSGGQIRYRILGPLKLERKGACIDVPPGQPTTVLAMLLLNAGRVVSVNSLIDSIWGDMPPSTARKNLHCHISRLRQLLRASGDPEEMPVLLTTAPGYLFDIDEGELDLFRFEALAEAGNRAAAAGNIELASARLRAALDLWRGPALANVESDTMHRLETPRLEERRLTVTEKWVDLELLLGHHAALVAGLKRLVATQPLRERLRYQLMLALARAGRPAEALQAYLNGWDILRNELGIEPGAALRTMQEAILAEDPALEWRPERSAVRGTQRNFYPLAARPFTR
jgi:DNA-binding SARP family transcriptional activator